MSGRALADRQRHLRALISRQRDAWASDEPEGPYSMRDPWQLWSPDSFPHRSLAELGFAFALDACRRGTGRRGPLLGVAFALLGARIAVLVRRVRTDEVAAATRPSPVSPDDPGTCVRDFSSGFAGSAPENRAARHRGRRRGA